MLTFSLSFGDVRVLPNHTAYVNLHFLDRIHQYREWTSRPVDSGHVYLLTAERGYLSSTGVYVLKC